MTIENKSTTETEPQTAPATVSDAAASLEATFKRELGVEEPKEEVSNQPTQTPEEGHPKPEEDDQAEAPADGKPVEEDGKPEDEKKDDPDDKDKTEEEPAKEEEPEEDTSLMDELLEVESEKNLDVPQLQSRLSEKDRYIEQLSSELRSMNETLASAGRKIINTPDGPRVAPSEDAPEFSPDAVDVEGIIKGLKPEEMDLFVEKPEEAAKLVAERTIKDIASKYMPVQASSNDSVLTAEEANSVYEDFINAKLSDGKTPKFPDADSPRINELIKNAYEKTTSPAMQKFKELAGKDKDVQHIMLEHLYNKVFRAIHVQESAKAARLKAKSETKEKHEKEPSVSSSGASSSVRGQQPSGSNKTWNDVFETEIAAMTV